MVAKPLIETVGRSHGGLRGKDHLAVSERSGTLLASCNEGSCYALTACLWIYRKQVQLSFIQLRHLTCGARGSDADHHPEKVAGPRLRQQKIASLSQGIGRAHLLCAQSVRIALSGEDLDQ
jgi:hypothetical protein